jgi:hypothetical protein
VSFIIKLIDKYKKNELNIKIKKIYVLKKLNEWSDTYRWYEPKKCIKRHLGTKKLGEWVWVIGRGWVDEDEMRQENDEEMKDKGRRYWILCPPWEV